MRTDLAAVIEHVDGRGSQAVPTAGRLFSMPIISLRIGRASHARAMHIQCRASAVTVHDAQDWKRDT